MSNFAKGPYNSVQFGRNWSSSLSMCHLKKLLMMRDRIWTHNGHRVITIAHHEPSALVS